jgi:hypothetical protein
VQSRDREQSEARLKLEKPNAELDKFRAMALEEIRHGKNPDVGSAAPKAQGTALHDLRSAPMSIPRNGAA